MSRDKYPSIFSRQMEAIVFIFLPHTEAIMCIILQIFFATPAVLKIGEFHSDIPQLSLGLFSHVTHLDQSRASDKMWYNNESQHSGDTRSRAYTEKRKIRKALALQASFTDPTTVGKIEITRPQERPPESNKVLTFLTPRTTKHRHWNKVYFHTL